MLPRKMGYVELPPPLVLITGTAYSGFAIWKKISLSSAWDTVHLSEILQHLTQ